MGNPLGPVRIPPGDPAGLAACGRVYAALANEVRSQASQLGQQVTTVDWQGKGATAFQDVLGAKGASYAQIQASLEQGSIAYSTYSRELDQAQAMARQAQGLVDQANNTASAMVSAQGAASQASAAAQSAQQGAADASLAALVPGAPPTAYTAAQQASSQADQAANASYQAEYRVRHLSDDYTLQRTQALSLADEAEALATAAAAKANGGFEWASKPADAYLARASGGGAGVAAELLAFETGGALGVSGVMAALWPGMGGTLPDGQWDPFASLRSGGGAGSLYPAGLNVCLPGNPHYQAGGFLVGPDGKRYPLVVPWATGPDGKRYNADVVPTTGTGVDNLLGLDPGWQTVALMSGIGAFGPKTGAFGKSAIFGAGLFGASVKSEGQYEPGALKRLQIGPTGYPSLGDTGQEAPQVQGPPTAPENTYEEFVPGAKGPEWTPTDPPPDVASGAVGLASGALAGAGVAEHINDSRPALNVVSLQQNSDGRTRALFRSYQVVAQPGGHLVIEPNYVTAGPNGQPTLVPMGFNPEEPVLGPPDWSVAPPPPSG